MSVDEIGFGPRREPRPPSRRLRGFAAAASIAGAAAAAIAIATTPPAPAAQQAVVPAPVLQPPSAICPPVQPTWPDLAALPAGLRPGALRIVVDQQFSGRCPAS
jgi:hypothetical protein